MLSKNFIKKLSIFKKGGLISRNLSALQENKINSKNRVNINKLVAKYKDLFYYSSFLEDSDIIYGYKRIKTEKYRNKIKEKENRNKLVVPLSLRLLNKDINIETLDNPLIETTQVEENLLQFKSNHPQPQEDSSNWLHDYENYTDSLSIENKYSSQGELSVENNKTPCGGCGAILHCEETNTPGYIPAVIFNNSQKLAGTKLPDLLCQRCHFLKTYNQALNVEVTPNDYLKVLSKVYSHEKALVILLVDLLDFPCSIWPGIQDLIGIDKKIFVVGNKVDLLPINDVRTLHQIKDILYRNVVDAGFSEDKIKNVSLISAKTGYGIEDLVSNLFSEWRYKGDVILIGCTNVGKSTLFNSLINSDYCKYYTANLIQKATTSPWPGTTINLLKFPILKLSSDKYQERLNRLKQVKQIQAKMLKLSKTQVIEKERHKYIITPENFVDCTFRDESDESDDLFSINMKVSNHNKSVHGVDESDKKLELSRWFYDTPGVVQPEQITDLLIMEELDLLFPKEVIKPKTFSLYPNSSIFIAGLARLDYLEGYKTVRFTVFCSSDLPITICKTSDAEEIYKTFLGTELLGIPGINNEKLKTWPGLSASDNFVVKGIYRHKSCADIVLSSAGWVSITPNSEADCTVRAWTPGKKGIYLRDSFLPRAVYYRGKRLKFSCAYSGNLEDQ